MDGAGVAADVRADPHNGVELFGLLIVDAHHVLDHSLGLHHIELHSACCQHGVLAEADSQLWMMPGADSTTIV